MRALGEQWIEEGSDGKRHMYKAVEGPCERCDISHTCNLSVDCHMERGLIAKDLGPVNEDGCLAEERTGEFPIIAGLKEEEVWVVRLHAGNVTITVTGATRQQAIDAWNWRA